MIGFGDRVPEFESWFFNSVLLWWLNTPLIEKEDLLPLNGWACSCSDNRMVEVRAYSFQGSVIKGHEVPLGRVALTEVSHHPRNLTIQGIPCWRDHL